MTVTSLRRKTWPIMDADLEALAIGAAILGTGGGGNPYLGKLRAQELLKRGQEIRILPFEELRDDDVIVSVPDLITLLDAQTSEPITTEGMRYGLRAVVLGIPCDPQWRTAAGLELVGPKYFGYQVDFVPVEQRFGQQAFTTHQAPAWQP